MPSWLMLRDGLRASWFEARWWQRWRWPWGWGKPVEANPSEERFHRVIRAKIALLLLDAGALGWILAGSLRFWGHHAISITTALESLAYLFVIVSVLGGALLTATLLGSLITPITGVAAQRAYFCVVYTALTPVAFVLGLNGGLLLAEAREADLLRLIFSVGALYYAVAGLKLILSPLVDARLGRKQHTWQAAFPPLAGLALLHLGLAAVAYDRQAVLSALRAALVMTPVWSLLLYRVGLDRLAHPYSRHRLRDPRLQPALRRRLRRAAIALALPLGGLVAPAWVYLRPQLRQDWVGMRAPALDTGRRIPARVVE